MNIQSHIFGWMAIVDGFAWNMVWWSFCRQWFGIHFQVYDSVRVKLHGLYHMPLMPTHIVLCISVVFLSTRHIVLWPWSMMFSFVDQVCNKICSSALVVITVTCMSYWLLAYLCVNVTAVSVAQNWWQCYNSAVKIVYYYSGVCVYGFKLYMPQVDLKCWQSTMSDYPAMCCCCFLMSHCYTDYRCSLAHFCLEKCVTSARKGWKLRFTLHASLAALRRLSS